MTKPASAPPADLVQRLIGKLFEVAARHNDRSCDYDVCSVVRDAHEYLNAASAQVQEVEAVPVAQVLAADDPIEQMRRVSMEARERDSLISRQWVNGWADQWKAERADHARIVAEWQARYARMDDAYLAEWSAHCDTEAKRNEAEASLAACRASESRLLNELLHLTRCLRPWLESGHGVPGIATLNGADAAIDAARAVLPLAGEVSEAT